MELETKIQEPIVETNKIENSNLVDPQNVIAISVYRALDLLNELRRKEKNSKRNVFVLGAQSNESDIRNGIHQIDFKYGGVD